MEGVVKMNVYYNVVNNLLLLLIAILRVVALTVICVLVPVLASVKNDKYDKRLDMFSALSRCDYMYIRWDINDAGVGIA